jgi:hypothetical protein
VDYYTHWVELFPLCKTIAYTITPILLREIFTQYSQRSTAHLNNLQRALYLMGCSCQADHGLPPSEQPDREGKPNPEEDDCLIMCVGSACQRLYPFRFLQALLFMGGGVWQNPVNTVCVSSRLSWQFSMYVQLIAEYFFIFTMLRF